MLTGSWESGPSRVKPAPPVQFSPYAPKGSRPAKRGPVAVSAARAQRYHNPRSRRESKKLPSLKEFQASHSAQFVESPPAVEQTQSGSSVAGDIAQGVGLHSRARRDSIADAERPHPPSFYCPISHQCMHDPVLMTDGQTYERRHIEQWLQDNDTSPVTGVKLATMAVFPNHALRNAIEEYFEQVLVVHRKAIKQAIAGFERSSAFSSNVTLTKTIASMMQCSVLINADLSVERVLSNIMQEVKTLVGAEVASVFLVDRQKNELYSTVNSTGGELRIPMKSGVAGAVAYSGIPLIIQHAYDDNRFNTQVDLETGFKTRSILCVPVRAWKGCIIGVAQLINKTNTGVLVQESTCVQDEVEFTIEDQQFFEVFAAQAGAAIVNSGMFERMPGEKTREEQLACRSSAPYNAKSLAEDPRRDTLHISGAHKSSVKDACAEEAELTALSPKKMSIVRPLLAAAVASWEMDTLALAELTGNRPLSTLGMHMFEHHGLISHFDIDRQKLVKFLLKIERGYPVTNQYHNRAHAASVLHFMNCLVAHAGLSESCVIAAGELGDRTRQQKLLTLGCLLAAIVHDYEHEGVTNDFLQKTQSDRAVIYNGQSPNENHHVAAAWFTLRDPDYNFLESLTLAESKRLHCLVVDLVLGTDMAKHEALLEKFKQVAKSSDRSIKSDAELHSADGFVPVSMDEAVVVLQLALKCADLGHLSLCWSSHTRWVQLLEDEFFAQGDREKSLAMPEVSFLMDRDKPGVSDSQVGFFNFMVLPLFREFVAAIPSAQPMLSAVEANAQKWKDIEAEFQK